MGKKAQAILPFFAVQLVSIMVFMIVLLTLMAMTKNVRFTINEFDERTAFLLAGRRLVSSADCFAYEERGIFYDQSTSDLYSGSRIYPGMLDFYKLIDYENFNCMRKDFYDKYNDVTNGVWDAANGTGAAFKYDIRVIDLKTERDIYNSPLKNFSTSLIGRVFKKEITSADDPLCDKKYGGDWDTILEQDCNDITNPACKAHRCWEKDDHSKIKPRWDTPMSDTYVFNDSELQAINFKCTPWTAESWTQFNTTCESTNSTPRSMIIPTMIKVGNEIHPAVMLFQSCVIFGQNYTGRTLLEFSYKPPQGGTCQRT